MRKQLRQLIPVMGLLIMILIFSFTTGGKFLNLTNLKSITMQMSITFVAACGTIFVMAHNNMDYSLGGACALCSIGAYFCSGGNIILFFIFAIIFGICCGFLSAFIHVVGRVPAFMGGMCIMFAGRGVAQTLGANTSMLMVSASKYNNIVFFLIVDIVVFISCFILFKYTKIGKYQKLIGSNPRGAELSGINVNKYKVIAFVISGATVGIASGLTLCRSAAVTGNTGLSLEINVLLSLCLGGLPLKGGSTSNIRSALIGTMCYFILQNGLLLWGLNADFVDIVKAIFFLSIVFITTDRSQQAFAA